jgi:hypothetical protein
MIEPVDTVEEACLSRAVGTYNGKDLPFLDACGNVRENIYPAESEKYTIHIELDIVRAGIVYWCCHGRVTFTAECAENAEKKEDCTPQHKPTCLKQYEGTHKGRPY